MRSRNRNVVYAGKVGAAPRQTKPRTKKDKKFRFECQDGPMKGYALFLSLDGITAPMSIAGQVGRYNQGKWEASCT